MHLHDLFANTYAEWLGHRQIRAEKNILRSFKTLTEEFYNQRPASDNTSLYLPTHAAFLIHALTAQELYETSLFAPGILLLNFILKNMPKFRVPLTPQLLKALKGYFGGEGSKELGASALWLVCRCLQGCGDKQTALGRLWESGLVEDFLREVRMEPQAEKAVAMLFYFISKHQKNRCPLATVLLTYEHRFYHPEAIKYVLATLREAGVDSL